MLYGRLGIVSLLLILPALALTGAPRAQADDRREDRREGRHLLAALHEMREARTELRESKHDFGSHRDKAAKALQAAVEETEQSLRAARIEVKTEAPARETYKKYENFPHLRHTLTTIKDARKELRESKHDFGGHRDKAIKALDYAAEQVEAALKFAK